MRGGSHSLVPSQIRTATPFTTHFFLLAAFVAVIAGCAAMAPLATSSAEDSVLQQLARYEDAILRMDHDAVASMYLEDAEVAHADAKSVRGRNAIRNFLGSFANYKVLANTTRADSTVITNGTATQTGRYTQSVRTPQGMVIDVAGRFIATWRRDGDSTWRLAHMHTFSD